MEADLLQDADRRLRLGLPDLRLHVFWKERRVDRFAVVADRLAPAGFEARAPVLKPEICAFLRRRSRAGRCRA